MFACVPHYRGGCTLRDSLAVPIGFTVLGSELLGRFVVIFITDYLFGLLFHILPMMQMGESNVAKAFVDAVKADTLALIAFETGMFGWLTIAFLLILPEMPSATSLIYWFNRPITTVIGFAIAYPADCWPINRGIKHGM